MTKAGFLLGLLALALGIALGTEYVGPAVLTQLKKLA
jgi:hypothetical protein